MSDQITCLICGNGTHSIARHLKEDHPGTTLEEYKERFRRPSYFRKSQAVHGKEEARKGSGTSERDDRINQEATL